MARILVITEAEWQRIEEYANYTGVSGGWQNLCRKLRSRVVAFPDQVPLAIEQTEKRERGLFGPIDPDS